MRRRVRKTLLLEEPEDMEVDGILSLERADICRAWGEHIYVEEILPMGVITDRDLGRWILKSKGGD